MQDDKIQLCLIEIRKIMDNITRDQNRLSQIQYKTNEELAASVTRGIQSRIKTIEQKLLSISRRSNGKHFYSYDVVRNEIKRVKNKKRGVYYNFIKSSAELDDVVKRLTTGITKSIKTECIAFLGNKCLACNTLEPHLIATLDHVVPQSINPFLAGQIVNSQPLCFDCNNKKANKEQTDYRTPEQKKILIQRLLHLRGDKLLPENVSYKNIEIITQRILLYPYSDISKNTDTCNVVISNVLHRYIKSLNDDIRMFEKITRKLFIN